jgi:hypothetical protein
MPLLHKTAPKLFGAKRKGDACKILLPSGGKRFGYFLGSGRFTNAFWDGKSHVYLYTLYDDVSKDILVEAHQRLPRNPHIPDIREMGTIPGPAWADWDIKLYKSKMYDTHVARHEMSHSAWYDRRELKQAHTDTHYDGAGYDFNSTVVRKADVAQSLHDALWMIIDVCQDHGDHIIFDNFAHKNTAVDPKGNLVLIDPVFDSDMLLKDMQRRKG